MMESKTKPGKHTHQNKRKKTKQQNKSIQYSIPTTKHIKNQQFETRCQHHNQNMRKWLTQLMEIQ